VLLLLPFSLRAETIHGAVQFGDDHTFTKTLVKFAELSEKYSGKKLNFVLHKNSELGTEKDYFAYMNQGISVDYGIVSPSHMSTFSKVAPLMDMPFLFRDRKHWEAVIAQDLLAPIAEEVAKKADVILLGYAGGGMRNLIVSKPIRNMAELKGLPIRVMGAPIQSQIFNAIGAAPTVIAYTEIYNAMQTGVIQAAENESLGIEQMKFYEVGPHIALTQHAITVRPLAFSGKTFRRLPKDVQSAILKAGKEAAEFGRKEEAAEDEARLKRMAKEGRLKTYAFAEREKLLQLAEPVKAAFAKEVGAEALLNRINAVK
jgi:tripartite ATP-independent transporter DctP family solute receptor